MAETIGWLTDKIIISELKIYHMSKQLERKDVTSLHKSQCKERVRILKLQRDDLREEMLGLFIEMIRGNVRPKIYRQFKMYNDPRFFSKRKS